MRCLSLGCIESVLCGVGGLVKGGLDLCVTPLLSSFNEIGKFAATK